jgi:hypothetical protein
MIFGREPVLYIQFIAAVLGVGVSLGFSWLTGEQAALIVAAINAVFAAWTAALTRPIAPAVFTGAVTALAALVTGYGANLSAEFVGAINLVVVAGLAVLVRGNVTPSVVVSGRVEPYAAVKAAQPTT